MRAAQAIALPEDFTIAQALMFQSLTAQYLVTEYREVQRGDRVLVHSAAGGVGLLLVQWLKHLGAWVVGTTSSEAKAATARAAGADAVIEHGRNYEFLDELRSMTGGRGVDLAFDGVGAATLEPTLKGLARGGTAVSIGSASGPAPAIRPDQLVSQSIRLGAGSVFNYTADPAELKLRAAAVIDGIQAGSLRVADGTSYPLDRAADAHAILRAAAPKASCTSNPNWRRNEDRIDHRREPRHWTCNRRWAEQIRSDESFGRQQVCRGRRQRRQNTRWECGRRAVRSVHCQRCSRPRSRIIVDTHGAIDILVNNAGVLENGNILEIDNEKLNHSLEVNFLAPLQLIRELVPGMNSRRYGRIVNVSSGYGSFAEELSGPAAYSISKAALNAVTVSLAKDLREQRKSQ